MRLKGSGTARKSIVDTAKRFEPETILLWRRVAEHPEAQRILGLFPSANVRLIEHQRNLSSSSMPQSKSLLAGKKTLMIGQTSSFVGQFDGWLGSNIRCCPYHKLVPVSNGCPYFCTYCYLAFVYRKFAPCIKVNINYDAMFKQIRRAMRATVRRISFNMGEMLDSLALDHITNLTTMLVPFFSGFSRACLMLLTKSSNIDNLLTVEPTGQTVVSWSLNSREMIEQYESGTASLGERIEAARRCQQHGYRIRIRIDPGILYPNWKAGYASLIQDSLSVIKPENITLGMLRLLPGHHRLAIAAYGNRAKGLCGRNFVKGASDGKLRYPPKQRVEFYDFLIETVRNFDRQVSISLCRETLEIWDTFKGRCTRGKCNCMVW